MPYHVYTLSVVGSVFQSLPLSLYRDGLLVPSFDSSTINYNGDHPILWGTNPLRQGNTCGGRVWKMFIQLYARCAGAIGSLVFNPSSESIWTLRAANHTSYLASQSNNNHNDGESNLPAIDRFLTKLMFVRLL
jgi:hypothetical protein